MERSVLLVDDDPDFRYMVRKALRSIGEFVIVEAGNGLEALRHYHHGDRKFDIVISDTRMPGMTGPALRTELASRGYEGRFLLMSGDAATVTFLAQKWISKGQKNEMRKSSETKAKNLVSKFSLNSAIFQTDIFLSKYI